PRVHPQAGHEVKSHARQQDTVVGLPETDGALAPVRRVGNPHRVAAAAFALDAGAFQRGVERVGDIGRAVAGARRLEAVLETLDNGLLRLDHLLGRRAEIRRAAQRRVVALVAAGDLEERAGALVQLPVVPGQVGRRGVDAGGQERHDGRVVAAVAVGAGDRLAVDLGDQLVLANSGLHLLVDALVHLLDDAR